MTGAEVEAFLRNLQLLEQEGYIELNRTMGTGFSSFQARATALLVREVERHGAATGALVSKEALICVLSSIKIRCSSGALHEESPAGDRHFR